MTGKHFDGERIRHIVDPDTLEHRAELTPAYARWWAERIARAEVDERAVEEWLMGGMVGRLVCYGDGPVEVEACDPDENGEFVIREYPERRHD